jgi:hypothetical protein
VRLAFAALVIVLCTGMVVGCGRMSPQQAAYRDAQQLFGDPDPSLIDVQMFTNFSGTREAAVVMQGEFRVPPSGAHSRYVVLDFLLPPGPATSAGYEIPTPSMVAATARARSANPLFKLFPDVGSPPIRCGIPVGSRPGGTIAGGCLTSEPPPTNHLRRVEFIEEWPLFRTNRYGGVLGWKHSARWIVTLAGDGQVQSMSVKGQPPQLWR